MRSEVKSSLLKNIGYLTLILFQGSSFAFLWFYYYVPLMKELNGGFYFFGNFAVIAIYLLIIVFFTKSFDGYKFAFLRSRNTCLSNVLAILCGNIVGNIQIWAIGNHYFSIIPMVLLTLAQWLLAILVIAVMRWINIRILKPEGILVIYDKYSPKELIGKASVIQDKFLIKETISIDKGIGLVEDKILIYDSILIYDLDSEKRGQIVKFCYDLKKKIYITPKITDIIISGAEELPFFDTPLLRVRERGLSIEAQVIKRAFDVIFSLLAIIATSPLMLIFATLIKVQDGGKIFYTQERLTKDEHSFDMIKFRSMVEDSEQDGATLAKHEDERVTTIGKFLRRTHLDELPQIFNILKGEMSLVGPRPEREEIAKEYEKAIPEFGYRLAVKAGLTGYAQVYGKYNTTPYDKLRLDLKYIENYSFGLDIKLLFMTFKVMFQKENTEGVKKEQKTALDDKK